MTFSSSLFTILPYWVLEQGGSPNRTLSHLYSACRRPLVRNDTTGYHWCHENWESCVTSSSECWSLIDPLETQAVRESELSGSSSSSATLQRRSTKSYTRKQASSPSSNSKPSLVRLGGHASTVQNLLLYVYSLP